MTKSAKPVRADIEDPDMKLTDGAQLVELTATKRNTDPPPSFDFSKLPRTLQEALLKEGAMFSNLWALVVYLRCGEKGLDGAYLRNAEVVRNRSRKLNWHQTLEMNLKEIRQMEDSFLAGQRGSRVSKWIASSKALSEKIGQPAPESVETGQIGLMNIDGKAAPALIHTLWPTAKKPKPLAQPVPLNRLRCFRGTVMLETAKAGELIPSDITAVFVADQVLAILDIVKADQSSGSIVLSPSSQEIMKKCKDEHYPVQEAAKRGRKRKQSADASDPLKPPNFKCVASRLRRLAQIRNTKGDDDQAAEKITPDEMRRSDRGRQAIRRVVVKACEIDAVYFRTNPSFDHITQKANVKGAMGYDYTDFIAHVPFYYQYLFHECRNPEKYGAAVHKDLSGILAELRKDPPCRKKFHLMIAECRSAKLSGSIEI